MWCAQAAADASAVGGWVGEGFGNGGSQGWDAQGAQLSSDPGCEHLLHDPGLCQELWGHTDQILERKAGTERWTHPTLDFKAFHGCRLHTPEPSSEQTPSKGQSIALEAEDCFLEAMALYIQTY